MVYIITDWLNIANFVVSFNFQSLQSVTESWRICVQSMRISNWRVGLGMSLECLCTPPVTTSNTPSRMGRYHTSNNLKYTLTSYTGNHQYFLTNNREPSVITSICPFKVIVSAPVLHLLEPDQIHPDFLMYILWSHLILFEPIFVDQFKIGS